MSALQIKESKQINGKEIKVIEGGFGEEKRCLFAKQIAEIHSMELKHVNELINRNRKRFKDNIDIVDVINNEDFKVVVENLFLKGSNRTKNIYALSERGYAKLVNIMKKDEKIASIVLKEYFDSDIVAEPSNTKEYYFYEYLSEYLEVFNLQGIKQYKILNYRIDYYIPKLNIAIEYDENNHRRYTYEQQEGRQKEIEKELGCKFIRVSDEYSIIKAAGIVSKEIFGIKGAE